MVDRSQKNKSDGPNPSAGGGTCSPSYAGLKSHSTGNDTGWLNWGIFIFVDVTGKRRAIEAHEHPHDEHQHGHSHAQGFWSGWSSRSPLVFGQNMAFLKPETCFGTGPKENVVREYRLMKWPCSRSRFIIKETEIQKRPWSHILQ